MALRRIGILLVHGIGEQKWFQTLDQITTNFYRALKDQYGADACRQVLAKAEALYLGDEAIWREAPVRLRWRKENNEYEAVFREVYWADLDEPENGLRFLRFVFWGLTVAATKKYDTSNVLFQPSAYGMRPPTELGWLEGIWVRIRLLMVSIFFLMLLLTIGVLHWLLRRLLQIGIFGRVMRILYDYLGDVKLYQDEYPREDRIETAGEKSRVVIRRRMITALVRMALDPEVSEYYLIAHSLGTVVAFNALMETEAALPNYLIQEMWDVARAAGLNGQLNEPVVWPQMPERPLWLTPLDGINRNRLFERLKGFMTLGSPLDKFAAVWPRIVPVNCQPIPNNIPWYNVADAQDIVGAKIDLFGDDRRDCRGGDPLFHPTRPYRVGGLLLYNRTWADQWSLFTAHTSYWVAREGKQNRFVNRMIDWVESGGFQLPPRRPALLCLSRLIFTLTLLVLMAIAVFVPAWFLPFVWRELLSWIPQLFEVSFISWLVSMTRTTLNTILGLLHLITDFLPMAPLARRMFDVFLAACISVGLLTVLRFLGGTLARQIWPARLGSERL